MTIHSKEDSSADVDAIQVYSAKELDHEFSEMLKYYHDKETEFNWEARERSITRIRGILRGNAPEAYLDVLVQGIKHMIDGIIKAVESLRTQLAIKALLLVGDIGIYIGKHLDAYIYDQLLMCMMRCAGITKKMVATASMQATITFLRHTSFYPKCINMFSMAMNDKNTQVRLFTVHYIKTLLQTHAHRDHTRHIMDKTSCTDQFETLINKGLNDATPSVREICREAFWIFWEHWRDRGEHLLKQLPPTAQKQLEKSKISNNKPVRTINSPTNSSGSLRASSSLGRHDLAISPSNSTLSNGSTGSDHHPVPLKSSLSRRSGSPHLYRYGSPPAMPSQLHNSPSPPPTSSPPVRKTRVPALNRKKSAVALGTGAKRKAPNFYTLLHSEDFSMRIDGIHQLAKKLSAYPYSTQPELEQIQLETTPTTHVDGETLKGIVLQQFEDPFHFLIYETLSSWECVTCVMLRLLTFEEYIPRLILDAYIDEPARRNEVDLVRYKEGKLALKRAKLFLQHEHPGLVDLIFTSLLQFGGFGAATPRIQTLGARKDIFKLPANRRKLTKEFIVWMDELVVPMIGLEEPIDLADPSYEGIPDQYIHSDHSTATRWFESDINIRHCLDILLPLVTAHSSGSLWHGPLITFMKHLRLLNQRLFDSITAGYDENTMNKICRVLGIHIRIEPAMVAPPVEQEEEQLQIEKKLDSVDQVAETKDELPAAFVPIPEIVTPKEQEQIVPEQQEEYTLIQEEKKDQPSFVDTYDEPLEQPSEEQQEYEPPKEVQPVYAEKPAVMDAYSPSEEEQQKTPELPDVVYNSKSHKVEPKAPDLAEVMYDKRLEEEEQSRLKSPIPDYFQSSMIPPLASNFSPNTVMENGFYANGDAGGILYTNHASTERSTPVAEMSASPQQQPLEQPPGVGQLQPSEPNKEKYPEPQFVPFFHPEKVSYSCPVFESNTRSTTTVSVRGGKDKTVLLYALIDKLKSLSNNMSDNINTFRKLTRLLKEVPIRRRWDQGGNEETGNETWAGGNGDGGNFVELVQSILLHLEQPPSRCMTSALECIRQLAMTQSGLFKFYERKSNSKGMTLESQLMEKLLELRSDENPTICIAAEDALDAVLSTLTPPTAFEMLMAFVVYRSVIAPYDEHSISGSRYHPVGTAFTYIAKWVKELNDVFYIEEWMAKGAVNAFFKGMNSSLVNIRKSCVEAIVALHEVVNDDIYLYLVDLREDQSNLIRHYVAKSLKKKASLRSIREAHQYL